MLAIGRLEPVDQCGQIIGVQVGILRALELRFLRLVERTLEGVGRYVHHDLAEHLDEPPVGISREPHIALGLLREPFDGAVVQPEVEDRVHHPGHRELRSGPDGDEERVLGIAEALVHRLLEPREMLAGLLQHLGRWATVAEEPQAGLGGDREPGRDREPHVRHLGEVGSLAAQEILHVLVAFGEVVDVLGHSRCPHALERSRSGQCTAVPARGLPRMTSAG